MSVSSFEEGLIWNDDFKKLPEALRGEIVAYIRTQRSEGEKLHADMLGDMRCAHHLAAAAKLQRDAYRQRLGTLRSILSVSVCKPEMEDFFGEEALALIAFELRIPDRYPGQATLLRVAGDGETDDTAALQMVMDLLARVKKP